MERNTLLSPNQLNILNYLPNADLLDLAAPPHLWNINTVSIGPESTTVEGWCLPFSGRPDLTRLIVNGQRFAPSFHEKPAGVYAELYPWHPNAAFAGFALSLPHSVLDARKVPELTFEVAESDGPPVGYRLCLLTSDLSFTIPDAEISARIGVDSAISYTMFGRSIYRAFDRALERATGKGFSAARRIIDWGCGSARVSRHIIPNLRADQTLTGFDIDAPAVDWSNRNIGPHFKTSSHNPPLDVESGSTDVVFAYSVFTHLAEEAFHVWLKEIHRILAPGGTVLFTVLGDFAMAALAPGFPRVAHQTWVKRGIYDDSGNAQLETIGVGGDIYRNTWVKRAFIKDALARAKLDLVAIESPVHFYQDLVVARKK